MERVALGVLVSGRGSNLAALLRATDDPEYPARVAVVISNVVGAGALSHAARHRVPSVVIPHRGPRERFERAVIQTLQAHAVRWVVCAGFQRLLTPEFLAAFPERVLNIHPSLLPAFPGRRAQAQALAAGAQLTGCTVHRVDAGVDTGPILAQATVPVLRDDDEERLSARILASEHRLLPATVRAVVTAETRSAHRSQVG